MKIRSGPLRVRLWSYQRSKPSLGAWVPGIGRRPGSRTVPPCGRAARAGSGRIGKTLESSKKAVPALHREAERDTTGSNSRQHPVHTWIGRSVQASAADLKSLTHSRQGRVQGLQIESGTRIIDLLVPMTFRSPRKGIAERERGLRKVGTSRRGAATVILIHKMPTKMPLRSR